MKQIEPGDRVLVDKRGTLFEAIVTEKLASGGILFEPCRGWVTYRTASAREVIRRLDPPPGGRRPARRRPSDEDEAKLDLYPRHGRVLVGAERPPQSAAAPG